MVEIKEIGLQARYNAYAPLVVRGGYIYDHENKEPINRCIQVLEENKSGLLILGNPGGGKTLFFEMCQRLIHPLSANMFVKINVLDVVLQFNNKEIGHGVFRKWSDKNVLFDDLGTEGKGFLFGDKVEVFEKFIQIRYELFRKSNIKTHFTTNLSKDQLKERYGVRCTSRLGEMCEIVRLGEKATYSDRRELKNFIGLPLVRYEMPKITEVNYENYKKNEEEKPKEKQTSGNKLREMYGTIGDVQAEVDRIKIEQFKKKQGL